MKLKKLTIDNIASIEHAEIDFSANPLADERLFLIAGETGSGKSTIIDCLCLALYGNTPRLQGRGRNASYSNDKDKDININDPKQLLRRGCGKGMVELHFDNDQGRSYAAIWYVHRANCKPDGALQSVERTLKTIDGLEPSVNISGINAVNKEVAELVGLSMNQFFRTVVLAQGKFAEFLNSDDTEKADLLEKMTGTEMYARVGAKIYAVFKEKRDRRDRLQEELEGITPMDPDEKQELIELIARLSREQEEVIKHSDGAKQMAQWLDEKVKVEQQLANRKQLLAEKEALTATPEHLEQQQLVADWEATIEPRRELKERQRAEHEMTLLQRKRPDMQARFDDLCAELRAAENHLASQRNQLTDIEEFIKHEEPNSKMYEAMKSILLLLKQRENEQENIDKFTAALEQEKQRLPKVEAAVKESFVAQQEQEKLVKQLEADYAAIDVAGINRRKDALTSAKQALIGLKGCNDAINQAAARLQPLKVELDNERQTLATNQAQLDDKRTIVHQARTAVERETDWNNLLQQAHKSLHKGDKCPVCGHDIDELRAPADESVLDELRAQLKKAEDDLRGVETAIAASGKAIKRIEKQIDQAQNDVTSKTTARDDQWQLASQRLAQCGHQTDTMVDNDAADKLIAILDNETSSLNSSLQQANELNNRITAERNTFTNLAKSYNKAVNDQTQAKESIKGQRDAIDLSTQRLASCNQELNKLFVMVDWQERMSQDDGFIGELQQRANLYQLKEKKLQQLKRDIDIASTRIPGMQADKDGIVGLVDNGKATTTVTSRLDEQWREFRESYNQWNNRLNNERDNAKRAQVALSAFLTSKPNMTIDRLMVLSNRRQTEIDDIKRMMQDINDAINRMKGEITALENSRKEQLDKKPDFAIENRAELDSIIRSSMARIKEFNETIAGHKAKINQDDENLKIAGKKREELEKAEAVFQQWHQFNEALGSGDGDKFKKIAQSFILGELLASANGYLQHFNDRYSLETNAESLTILVRDQVQGSLSSVNTLSGGENFMVSLALALALSNMSGKIFSVDTMFIDEGFGSLSENYLDSVMETLNRLYDIGGGRRVGIISHVALLKERVPTQIQVERDKGNNTVSRVNVTSR